VARSTTTRKRTNTAACCTTTSSAASRRRRAPRFHRQRAVLRPGDRGVIDYHHGVGDLKQKTLRMIGEPRARYREDPVRMLRAVRLAAKLGLLIDPEARKPIREMAVLLENVPPPACSTKCSSC
jgi:hypothetical protein